MGNFVIPVGNFVVPKSGNFVVPIMGKFVICWADLSYASGQLCCTKIGHFVVCWADLSYAGRTCHIRSSERFVTSHQIISQIRRVTRTTSPPHSPNENWFFGECIQLRPHPISVAVTVGLVPQMQHSTETWILVELPILMSKVKWHLYVSPVDD